MPSLAAFLKGTGALLILHSAYSCMHYRSILQGLDLVDEPPLDVMIEVALAFALILIGELRAMGPLQSVEVVDINTNSSDTSSSTKRHKPLVAQAHKTREFDIYSNRSKLLFRRTAAAR